MYFLSMSLKQTHVALGDISIYTIQKAVKKPMSEGRIEKVDDTKGARYVYRRHVTAIRLSEWGHRPS